MSDITFVLIFILILVLIAVYLGYRYVDTIETRLHDAENKNILMTVFLLKKDHYAEYVTWKNTYTAQEFLSDISAISDKSNNTSTKDNTNEY